jgi:hypothetical protein
MASTPEMGAAEMPAAMVAAAVEMSTAMTPAALRGGISSD